MEEREGGVGGKAGLDRVLLALLKLGSEQAAVITHGVWLGAVSP